MQADAVSHFDRGLLNIFSRGLGMCQQEGAPVDNAWILTE